MIFINFFILCTVQIFASKPKVIPELSVFDLQRVDQEACYYNIKALATSYLPLQNLTINESLIQILAISTEAERSIVKAFTVFNACFTANLAADLHASEVYSLSAGVYVCSQYFWTQARYWIVEAWYGRKSLLELNKAVYAFGKILYEDFFRETKISVTNNSGFTYDTLMNEFSLTSICFIQLILAKSPSGINFRFVQILSCIKILLTLRKIVPLVPIADPLDLEIMDNRLKIMKELAFITTQSANSKFRLSKTKKLIKALLSSPERKKMLASIDSFNEALCKSRLPKATPKFEKTTDKDEEISQGMNYVFSIKTYEELYTRKALISDFLIPQPSEEEVSCDSPIETIEADYFLLLPEAEVEQMRNTIQGELDAWNELASIPPIQNKF